MKIRKTAMALVALASLAAAAISQRAASTEAGRKVSSGK
jgi:hypothetical protein